VRGRIIIEQFPDAAHIDSMLYVSPGDRFRDGLSLLHLAVEVSWPTVSRALLLIDIQAVSVSYVTVIDRGVEVGIFSHPVSKKVVGALVIYLWH
jgi:hypothetical protein